jgi:hypothetical protein
MMRKFFDRFRYRCHLWWRERREDYVGQADTHPLDYESPVAAESEHAVLVTESTPRFLLRSLGLYFGAILIAALVFRLVIAIAPGTAPVVRIVFLALTCLWTLFNVFATAGLCKARKAHRSKQPNI